MGGLTEALLLLVIILHYNPGFGAKLKVFERLDDLELDVVTERIERRKSLRKIENSLENIEGRLNISLSLEGPSEDEIQRIEQKLNEIKELLGNTKLVEISETFHLLRKGFNAEKNQSLRFRRRVSQIEDVLALLRNNSEALKRNTFAFFDDLRETNRGLREINPVMKEMYENTSNALRHVTDVLEIMTTEMVNVVSISSVLETTIKRTMAEYSLELRQEMKKNFLSCIFDYVMLRITKVWCYRVRRLFRFDRQWRNTGKQKRKLSANFKRVNIIMLIYFLSFSLNARSVSVGR